jgi:hypothetical protein
MDEYARFTWQIQCTYVVDNSGFMKRTVGIFVVILIFISACGSPKPYYKTAKGKKKKKYYNEIEFGGKSASTMKAPR